ncbi:hypothetical protein SKAU_G00337800 [Synaphobranchus kaupii]|uniref:Uncharacterized protein n=1 Tax=Synaphobranchus kaupii TaxID=118154 RepID=A0A9Q1IJ82_SYNKA|nr:hypothetical protein SKAU_G00337800 [Synaphobranchus kaupii]
MSLEQQWQGKWVPAMYCCTLVNMQHNGYLTGKLKGQGDAATPTHCEEFKEDANGKFDILVRAFAPAVGKFIRDKFYFFSSSHAGSLETAAPSLAGDRHIVRHVVVARRPSRRSTPPVRRPTSRQAATPPPPSPKYVAPLPAHLCPVRRPPLTCHIYTICLSSASDPVAHFKASLRFYAVG